MPNFNISKMRRLLVASILLLSFISYSAAVPRTPKEVFCLFCEQFGRTVATPLDEGSETGMDIAHRLFTACISLSDSYASRCRWIFKRIRDQFAWLSRQLSEFPEVCYGVTIDCPHLENQADIEFYREAFLVNAGQSSGCERCKNMIDGLYDALRTEDKRVKLERQAKLICSKIAFFSQDYCERQAPSIIERALMNRSKEFCQRLGLCKKAVPSPRVSKATT